MSNGPTKWKLQPTVLLGKDFKNIGDCKASGTVRFQLTQTPKIGCFYTSRTSPWNPKENLPPEYGRIYKISNFKRTKKIVLNEIHQSYVVGNEDIVRSNQFVTLHIANVPLHITGYFCFNIFKIFYF
jgi:hypothetical protein